MLGLVHGSIPLAFEGIEQRFDEQAMLERGIPSRAAGSVGKRLTRAFREAVRRERCRHNQRLHGAAVRHSLERFAPRGKHRIDITGTQQRLNASPRGKPWQEHEQREHGDGAAEPRSLEREVDSECDQPGGRKKWYPRKQSNVPGRRGEGDQRKFDLAQIARERRFVCELRA